MQELTNNADPAIAMENIAPPPSPEPRAGDPQPAGPAEYEKLRSRGVIPKSLAGAALAYQGKCEGGDAYVNNCAHYLSDAFIRAGYTELLPPNQDITARCTPAKRPIRAAEMNAWFKRMATQTVTSYPQNSGFWAVFQFDTSHYCCGHVLIVDTDHNVYFGTGNYPTWAQQFFYKW